MFWQNSALTKRQLGFLLLAAGTLGILAILSVDVLDAAREGGIGPAQRIGLVITALAAVVGLTLIPLGDRPA